MNSYEDEGEGFGWGKAAALTGLAALASPFGRPIRKQIGRANTYLGDPLHPVLGPLAEVAQNLKGAAHRSANDVGGLGDLMSKAYAHRAEGVVEPAEPGFAKNAFDSWENTKGIVRAIGELARLSPATYRQLRGLKPEGEKGFSDEMKKAFMETRLARILGDDHANAILSLQGFEHPNDAAAFYLKKVGLGSNGL